MEAKTSTAQITTKSKTVKMETTEASCGNSSVAAKTAGLMTLKQTTGVEEGARMTTSSSVKWE